ncbi:ParA family protein [Halovulum marinum]|uniref:ParA family protein n=1 Tax=Halovulum marinum TaxID=2662447 RepID=UPI002D792383|nr:ParA family protein [Halovulum marinum]
MSVSERPPRIIAITNQKGGVGKTTTTINLGASLALMGERVLLVDMDPQGNASTGLGIGQAARDITSYDVLMGHETAGAAILPTATPGLSIIPATPDLSSIDLELAGERDRITRLRNALRDADLGRQDYVLIDCPPSLNLLTVNALVAADGVLVPLQCEFFALEGITQLLRTVGEIRQSSNKALITQGIILTMYDQRNNLTSDVETDVRENLGALVFKTVIPRNVRLSEAPSHGIPALAYDPRSSGSQAYVALARELRRRVRARQTA